MGACAVCGWVGSFFFGSFFFFSFAEKAEGGGAQGVLGPSVADSSRVPDRGTHGVNIPAVLPLRGRRVREGKWSQSAGSRCTKSPRP